MVEPPKKEVHLVGTSSDFQLFYYFFSYPILEIVIIQRGLNLLMYFFSFSRVDSTTSRSLSV